MGFSLIPEISEYNAGFFVTFQDCYVSVLFSAGNYCDNYSQWQISGKSPFNPEKPRCDNAEVAIVSNKGGGDNAFITKEILANSGLDCQTKGDVIACCTPEQFASICVIASKWRNTEQQEQAQ